MQSCVLHSSQHCGAALWLYDKPFSDCNSSPWYCKLKRKLKLKLKLNDTHIRRNVFPSCLTT
jgi:hypothetical protein